MKMITKSDLNQLEGRIQVKFDKIDHKFKQIDTRFTQVDSRFDQLESTLQINFAQINHKFIKLEEKLQSEIRTNSTEIRIELEKKIKEGDEETRRYMGILHEDMMHKLDLVLEGFKPLVKKNDSFEKRI